MREQAIVVENREQLWYLLAEASQLEHGIMSCSPQPSEALCQGRAKDVLVVPLQGGACEEPSVEPAPLLVLFAVDVDESLRPDGDALAL